MMNESRNVCIFVHVSSDPLALTRYHECVATAAARRDDTVDVEALVLKTIYDVLVFAIDSDGAVSSCQHK